MNKKPLIIGILFLLFFSINCAQAKLSDLEIKAKVDQMIKPLMAKEHIPGMAVAIAIDGHEYFFNYGVIASSSKQAITKNTLFKMGSFTKTFTALLTAELASERKLTLEDPISNYFPQLNDSAFKKTTIENLATHTSGLPLFPPEMVQNTDQFINFIKGYSPTQPSGSYWIFSNSGYQLLGLIDAKLSGSNYKKLLKEKIIGPLGLKHTFFEDEVPSDQLATFTQTYGKSAPRKYPLTAASDLVSSSQDLLRYTESYLNNAKYPQSLQAAFNEVLIPRYKVSYFYQGLAWEQYDYDLDPNKITNETYLVHDVPVIRLDNHEVSHLHHMLVSKAIYGKTDSVYVGFIPEKNVALVIFANKYYPLVDRAQIGLKLMQLLNS